MKLKDAAFAEQGWAEGMLQLEHRQGRELIMLQGEHQRSLALLFRPVLAGIYSDSISFAGLEREGSQWVAQTWYCETRRSQPVA